MLRAEDEVVLVTGGTGSIGRPLVEALARAGHPVVVLVRGTLDQGSPGIDLLAGDIQRDEALGLDAGTCATLRDRVSIIIHAAALTRFDAPLEAARAVNVEGTRHVLAFAGRCPNLRRLCALSTVYVAGRRTGRILEEELDHDRGFVNAYEQSKYETEQVLRKWMSDLPIAICRLSTAIGDSTTGAVQRPAAIHHAIRFLYHSLLPMIPGSPESPVDLIATDYAVAALRHLSGRGFVPGHTFHVCAGADAIGEQALVDLAVEAFLRYRPAWRRRAIEKPPIVELETFELFQRSVDAVADPALRASVAVLSPFAPQLSFPKTFDDSQCLAALADAGIVRPPVRETMMRVVRYLIENNWGSHEADGGAAA
jgi:nucleoside-diphosphate-sugar epimerase